MLASLERNYVRDILKRALAVKFLFARRPADSPVRSVVKQLPCLDVVPEVSTEKIVCKIISQCRIVNWCKYLDTAIQVSRHPVGAACKYDGFTAVLEIINTAVFEQSPDDTSHMNV